MCRDCLLADQQCLTDSQCCIGICDTDTGTCASCAPEGAPCNQIDYAPDGCCWGNDPQLKCSKESKTCFACTDIGNECSSDDECCYSCCEKGFGKSTGTCTDGDMCHMGRIIIGIIIVELAKYAVVIGAIVFVIYWICKHIFGSKRDESDNGNGNAAIRSGRVAQTQPVANTAQSVD